MTVLGLTMDMGVAMLFLSFAQPIGFQLVCKWRTWNDNILIFIVILEYRVIYGWNLFVGVIYNVSEAPNLSSKYVKESLKLCWSTVSSTQMTNEASHPPIPGKAWVWHSNGLIWGLKWKEFTRNHDFTGQALNVLICFNEFLMVYIFQ